MHCFKLVGHLATAMALFQLTVAGTIAKRSAIEKRSDLIAPKVVIISMFGPEADVWYGIPEFDVGGLP